MAAGEVKRARITAIVFGTLSSIALIASVYAFIQQEEAKRNALMVNQYSERARQCEERSEQMQILAEHQRDDLHKKNEALLRELVKLRNSRTK